MPSGRTHDRITLWSLPVVAGFTFSQTQSGNLTLLVSGGFLFGGLMFGPDLDIYSRQFQRWGWLRWIWIPYQKNMRHRSFLSHGPVVGTSLRSLYLVLWIGTIGGLGLFLAESVGLTNTNWQTVSQLAAASVREYPREWAALFVGLELGAMSHTLSDWGGSTFKRFKSGGLNAIVPKMNKAVKSPRGSLEKRTAKTQKPQKKK
ncbi:MAG TPA: metal-binding protein [Leptolyngbyaceae cyanobacterium]